MWAAWHHKSSREPTQNNICNARPDLLKYIRYVKIFRQVLSWIAVEVFEKFHSKKVSLLFLSPFPIFDCRSLAFRERR